MNRRLSIALIFLTTVTGMSVLVRAGDDTAPRLAIIGDGHTRNQADLLLLELQKANCELVERDQIDRVLGEQALQAAMNRAGSQRIGRLLKADGLILLSGEDDKRVTVRLVAVAPGVVTWYAETEAGKDWAPTVALALAPYFPKLAVSEKEAVPVSVLPVRAAFGAARAIRLADDVNRLLLLRLVRERALFVLERENLASVEQESLWSGDAPSFWAGSYVLEGRLTFDLVEDRRVTLTLELRPPPGGQQVATAAIVEQGDADELAGLVERAVGRVRAALGAPNHGPAWDLVGEANRLRGIVESLEDPEQQKNVWATIMALGCHDLRTAQAYRNALRTAGYRDPTRFSGLHLRLAPTAAGLEAQARNLLELLCFHNSYRPAEGFTAEQAVQWFFCYFPPLGDIQGFFETVRQTRREGELGDLLASIQAEADRTAERMLELDPKGQKGLAAVQPARYRKATTREILGVYRRWIFAPDLPTLEVAQRSTADAWFLNPEQVVPVFAGDRTEAKDERERLWQAWVAEVRASKRAELRIALARQTIGRPPTPEAGLAACRDLQGLLLDNAGLFEFPMSDALLADAFSLPQKRLDGGDTQAVRGDAENALRILRALIRNGMLCADHGVTLLKPWIGFLGEPDARELCEVLRRYVPGVRHYETVGVDDMLRWLTGRFPALMTDDLRFELVDQPVAATTPPPEPLQVADAIVLPEYNGYFKPPEYGLMGRAAAEERYWVRWGDDMFCVDPVSKKWIQVPFPPEHVRGKKDAKLQYFSNVGASIIGEFLMLTKPVMEGDEFCTLLGLRPIAGGEWRTVKLPFTPRGAVAIGRRLYIGTAVRQIAVYQNAGLIEMDADTLKCRTLRAPGTPTPRARWDGKGDVPFDALEFEYARARDGLIVGSIGRKQYGWDPETGAIKPLGPTPGEASLASTDAISHPFGFDLVTYFGVPHIDRAPTPALRVIRRGSQTPENVPLEFRPPRSTDQPSDGTPIVFGVNTMFWSFPTATCLLVPCQGQRYFWRVPYADIQGWLDKHPAKGAQSPTAEAAKAKPGTNGTLRIDIGRGETMDFCWVPPGEFMMGSPETEIGRSESERLHKVRLTRGFWMSKYEVMVKQCQAVLGRDPNSTASYGPDYPKMLFRADAELFITKLAEKMRAVGALPELAALQPRLPTEAEWEYACRAGTSSALYTGHELPFAAAPSRRIDEIAWTRFPKMADMHPVGLKRPNAWGLYDMCGNADEWCLDWYGDYPAGTVVDPTGPASGERRVARGGSGYDFPAACRSAARVGLERSHSIAGIRAVLVSGESDERR